MTVGAHGFRRFWKRRAAWSWRWIAGLIVAIHGSVGAQAENAFFPKGTNLSSLVVISEGNLATSAQKVLIATLQGIVARQSSEQIYIDAGGGYSGWYRQLNTTYAVAYTIATNPWAILTQFKGFISGYVLYNKAANSNSVNAATSLCGFLNAVAVDASIEASVRSYGVTNRLADVRAANDAWVWTNYFPNLNHDVVMEQKTDFDDDLRDYAAMCGAFMFFDGNSPFRSQVISQMNPDAACLGWGDASQGESVFVGNSSDRGVFTIAADYALNLSTLSGVRDTSVFQRTYSSPVAETNVHYVTFVMSDGDNAQWNLGGEPSLYNNPVRGKLNMGWSLSPSLADLAPSVLRWHYDYASSGPNRDFFVAGPSGVGYMYPSRYPASDLDLHVQKLNDFMGRADMNIGQIIDFSSFSRLDLWNKYLAQPNIDALLYLEYVQYDADAGTVEFSTNGKPVIACRDLLNSGQEDESTLAANINGYPRDPSSSAGYTFVCVNVWSKSQANVYQVVTNLASDVRVVTPDVFVQLIRSNIGRKLAFDFASTLQGWAGGTSGKPYDRAYWTSTYGNPSGALLLDGSDMGQPDSQPNSWFSRQIILPANATAVSFDTRADNDGLLRVRLQPPGGGYVTLLDWSGLTTHNTWVNRTADISLYAGQTVTLWFEQNDGGRGSGEYRYIDNVVISTSGAPQYLPAAPKLLSASGTTNATLVWRNNDVNESGFDIERSDGAGGVWNLIGAAASNATTYVDNTAQAGGAYAYRLRSRNGAGYSPFSNVRSSVAPVSRFPLGPANAGFESGSANWNTGGAGGSAGSVSYSNSLTNGPGASGANCILETSDGSGSVDFRSDDFALGSAIDAAAPVTFSFDYNILGSVKSANQIRVGLRFEDAVGGFLGEHNSYIGAANGDAGGNKWKHFSVTATPTATALSADIRVSMNIFGDDTWSSGPVLFDNFRVVSGINHAPVVGNITMGTLSGMSVTRSVIGGASGAYDTDGDTLTVSSIGQPIHGRTMTDGATISYIPNAGYVGTDSFSFTVSDGLGGMTTAIATVQVNGNPGVNAFIGSTNTGATNFALTFSGAPDCQYVLEWTASLASPVVWMPQATNMASASGLVVFSNTPTGLTAFWRTRLVP